jgi:hypothetical protein
MLQHCHSAMPDSSCKLRHHSTKHTRTHMEISVHNTYLSPISTVCWVCASRFQLLLSRPVPRTSMFNEVSMLAASPSRRLGAGPNCRLSCDWCVSVEISKHGLRTRAATFTRKLIAISQNAPLRLRALKVTHNQRIVATASRVWGIYNNEMSHPIANTNTQKPRIARGLLTSSPSKFLRSAPWISMWSCSTAPQPRPSRPAQIRSPRLPSVITLLGSFSRFRRLMERTECKGTANCNPCVCAVFLKLAYPISALLARDG